MTTSELLLAALVLLTCLSCCSSVRRNLPDIYWNSTNPIFDISNTDHVIAVNLLDKVNIICPLPVRHGASGYEYSKLYAVSSWSYDNCELTSSKRMIGVCQKPHQRTSISIVFRRFSPLPGAMEFQPGHSYYIISTSDGSQSGIEKSKGGLCLYKHMKVKFEVQLEERAQHSEETVDEHLESKESKSKWSSDHERVNGAGSPDSPVAALPANVVDPVEAGDHSSTPIMYIIHTKNPEDDIYGPYHHRSDQQGYQDVKAVPDGVGRSLDGGLWRTVAIATLLFAALDRCWMNADR